MSIFQKDCPQCAAPNPVSAALCACGHCFDPEAVTDKKAVVEVAIHEERLYHDYLAARVIQAEAAYEVARADADVDPDDTYKAAQALSAEQALNTARAELRIQAQKTSRLKRPPARIASVAATTAAAPRPTMKSRMPKRKSAAHTPPARTAKPNNAPVPSAKPSMAPRPIARSISVKPVTMPAPVAMRPAPTPIAKPIPPTAAPVAAIPAASMAKPATRPSEAFRARQAKKAEAIVRSAPMSSLPAPIAPPAPAIVAAPKRPEATTKECPNCTAAVPLKTDQCRCGFGFRSPSMEMAPLSLDAGALAILRR